MATSDKAAHAGSSELTAIDGSLLLARYEALNRENLELSMLHFRVLREFAFLIVAIFGSAFFVSAGSFTRATFYFVFGSAVPWLASVGLIIASWYARASDMAAYERSLMAEFYPGVVWPPHISDMRARGYVSQRRNRYGHYAGSLLFIGMSCGSIALALLRGSDWSGPISAGEAAALIPGGAAVVLQVCIDVSVYRNLKRAGEKVESRAELRAQRHRGR